MARGVNKVILVGNVGVDPEVKFMPSGGAVTNFSVATSESWKDKNTGERQDRTEWHRVVAFNRLAEIIGEYVRKGSQLYVEGSIRTRKWQGQDGRDNYTTEIVANDIQMLGSRGGGGTGQYDNSASQGGGGYQQQRGGGQAQAAAPQAQNQQQNQQGMGNQPPPAFDDFEDDIPF